MPSRRGSIVKVSPFVPAPVETPVKPAPAELAAAFAKLKTAKPDFPYAGHPDREVVAVVDPYSTGACVAAAAAKRGFKIIHVMSAPDSGTMEEMVPKHLRGLSYIATLRANEALPFAERAKSLAAELRKACGDLKLVAVLPGAEVGVELSEALAAETGLRGNAVATSRARRDKNEMGEKVQSAGVRAVRQLKTTEWSPVAAWLVADWGLPPDHTDVTPCALVVKPIDSAGSDGVTLCETVGAARAAVAKLVGATNALGIKNEAVLVQEWLRGDELCGNQARWRGLRRDNSTQTRRKILMSTQATSTSSTASRATARIRLRPSGATTAARPTMPTSFYTGKSWSLRRTRPPASSRTRPKFSTRSSSRTQLRTWR